tara:strand:- start:616 stop:1536 length:921 start_codon:yes stop_codon:yes gene_type:complete
MSFRFFIIFNLLLIFFCLNDLYAQKNKILFKIDNEIITSIDLLEEIKYLTALNVELENSKNEVVYEIAKKSLIRHKIKELEILEKLENYQIEQNILNNIMLNQFRKININTKLELENYLKNNKIDIEHIKNRIKIEILWNEFIYAKFSSKIKIDKNKIEQELQNKKKENEFLLSEILFDISTDESLENKFKQIQKIIDNEGFSKAALAYSVSSSSDSGGNIGWIRETTLNKNIKNQLKNIKIGNYTRPIVIPGGFLILKIENKKEIEINLQEAIKKVYKEKINEQLNQFSTIYYNKVKKNKSINEF